MKARDYFRLVTAMSAFPLLAQAPPNQGAQPAQARPPQQRLSESTGINVFAAHCTQCHGIVPVEHAPTEATIRAMTPEAIYAAITTGTMRANAANLTDAEKRLLAEFMGGRKLDAEDVGDAKNMPNRCSSRPPVADLNAPAWNGWSDLSNTRFQDAKDSGLSAGKVSRLKLKWAFGFPGATAMYGQTIVDGRVFVSSNAGYVYALEAQSGCIQWSYKSPAVVRSGITIGPLKSGSTRLAAFFGDIRGYAYALDASTGQLIWRSPADNHPLARVVGNPRLYQGRLYVPLASLEEDEARSPTHICCTFRGAITAFDSETGKQIWKSYTIPEEPKVIKRNSAGVDYMGPSGAGVWNSPIIDTQRRALYFGTGNSFSEPASTSDSIMAMDLDTGKILWSRQAMKDDIWHGGCPQTVPNRPANPTANLAGRGGRGSQPPYPPENCVAHTGPDWDYAASPNLATMPDGRTVVIASPKQAVVRALDPDKKGATIWEQDIARGIGGGAGETVFGGAIDRQTVYFGLQLGNGLAAVDLATGVEKWFRPLQTAEGMGSHKGVVAAVSLIPGVLFAAGMDGVLRAVSPNDGSPIWEFNTAQEFETVNKISAKGGSIGAGGPTIAGGMVFVSSGYVGFQNGVPGNVLLAFTPAW
jgi:polyvinyl alcohol dehydrogenase (cytochrome)